MFELFVLMISLGVTFGMIALALLIVMIGFTIHALWTGESVIEALKPIWREF